MMLNASFWLMSRTCALILLQIPILLQTTTLGLGFSFIIRENKGTMWINTLFNGK